MKNRFLLTILCLFALTVNAQVKVQLMNDSINYKKLRSDYPAAVSSREQATTRDLTFQKITADYWSDFKLYLKRKGFRPDTAIMIYTEGYFQPTGKADFFLYQYTIRDIRPSAKSEQQFLSLLTEFLNERPLPVTSSLVWSTFRVGSQFALYKPSARKVSHERGTINDLATAARTTQPDTVKKLSFGGLELEQVPDVIYRFTNVEEIGLGNNYLRSLPAKLTTLPHLQRLDLMSNRLREDSIFFTRNKNLRSINLQKNAISAIPATLGENRRLESLWLGNNDLISTDMKPLLRLRRLNDLNLYNVGLTELPKSMGRLKHLKVLDLYYNKLTALPKQISRMKRLEQLAIAYNSFSTLPTSLAKARRLQVLYAHHNRLNQLPEKFSRLNRLRILDISHNGYVTAPSVLGSLPSLEELSLNNNNIQEFPTVLTSIKTLKKVYLSANPLWGSEAMASPYAKYVEQLQANQTEVFY
jgi:Leucine-rich repeat (LRR) protein